jgi:hypothetical protein
VNQSSFLADHPEIQINFFPLVFKGTKRINSYYLTVFGFKYLTIDHKVNRIMRGRIMNLISRIYSEITSKIEANRTHENPKNKPGLDAFIIVGPNFPGVKERFEQNAKAAGLTYKVLGDGISYEMRCHDLPRFPSDVKTSDIIFDKGNAASSFMVPLEARMIPLG